MDYERPETLTEDAQEAIASLLRSHNTPHNSVFFTARDGAENSPKPLNVVVDDAKG